jgi:uncharacterized oxidoreductase
LLVAAGAGEEEAQAVAHSLVASNLCGHDSHGVVRIAWYARQIAEGELVPGAEFEVLHETPALLACDGHFGFGQVQARRLLERTMDRARTMGVASGTLRNCGHIGRLGEYTEAAATAGLTALLTCNDNGIYRVVAPPGGIEPRVSTNPISIAVPTDQGPVVFDASTSAVAQGKTLVHRLDRRPCPEGWLQDARGNPTTDPFVLEAEPPGALLPLGGAQAYKGFGLAVMLDMLVGGLSGGFCPPPQPGARMCNTVLLVVWDPERFGSREHLVQQASLLVESIRTCPRKPGVEEIPLPGDHSRATRARRQAEGIPLQEGTWQKLCELAERLEVSPPPEESI